MFFLEFYFILLGFNLVHNECTLMHLCLTLTCINYYHKNHNANKDEMWKWKCFDNSRPLDSLLWFSLADSLLGMTERQLASWLTWGDIITTLPGHWGLKKQIQNLSPSTQATWGGISPNKVKFEIFCIIGKLCPKLIIT